MMSGSFCGEELGGFGRRPRVQVPVMVFEDFIGMHLLESVGVFRLNWIWKMPFPKICSVIPIASEDSSKAREAHRV